MLMKKKLGPARARLGLLARRRVLVGAVLMAASCQRPSAPASPASTMPTVSSATVAVAATPAALAASPPVSEPAAGDRRASEPGAPSSGERRVGEEPSAYGKFAVTVRDADACHVSLRLSAGSEVPLFVVPDCSGDVVGMNLIGATRNVGSIQVPFVAPNGDEFHVFEIASARGGNATDANDYWIVVARSGEAWSTHIEASVLGAASRADTPTPSLVLEEPATTTAAGQRYSVSFRNAARTELPKIPSTIRSREIRDLAGELSGGYHASNWRPVVSGEGKQTPIDDKGRCALPDVGQQRGDVIMKVEVTTWSDGRTQVKCLSVEALRLTP